MCPTLKEAHVSSKLSHFAWSTIIIKPSAAAITIHDNANPPASWTFFR